MQSWQSTESCGWDQLENKSSAERLGDKIIWCKWLRNFGYLILSLISLTLLVRFACELVIVSHHFIFVIITIK